MKPLPLNQPIRNALKHLAIAVAVAAGLGGASANATPIASVAAGDWNNPATWSPAQAPVAGDDVTLASGFNVTVTADAACASVTFGATTTTTLSINPGMTLSVSGTLTIPRPSGNNTVAVGDGFLNAGHIAFTAGGGTQRHFLTINQGTVTVAGDVYTVAPTTTSAVMTFTGTGLLKVGGAFFTGGNGGGTFNKGTGTVEYNGSAQTVKAFAYHNLTLTGSGAKAMGTGITGTGKLTIAPTGSAYASVASGANLAMNKLIFGGTGQFKGTWGSSGSTATNQNNTYFDVATSGILTVAVDSSPSACEILTFGPGGILNQGARTIVWKVPPGSNLATLAPAYTVSEGATCPQPNPGIPTPNFSGGPVDYIVTAQDGIASKKYTVTIEYSHLPIWGGLACWYDASDGVTPSGGGTIASWNDLSGNGHTATPSGSPILALNQLNGKPAAQFRGNHLNCAGTFFAKEQYVVLRSPTSTWSGYGAFLGRATGRGSSYMMDPNGPGFTGFWADQAPLGVSMNGTSVPIAANGNHIFSLGPIGIIQNYMILKIVVNNNDTSAAAYQIADADGNQLPCDIAEIIAYDTTLSSTDEAAVGSYLANKYAITTAYPLISVPAAPTAVVAEPLLHSIRLSWTAAWSATSYNIYRGTASGVYDPTPIGTTTGTTIHTDVGGTLVDGITYYYVVKAVNSIGEGAASNEAAAAPTSGKVNQTITFGPLASKTYGDAPFSLTATASSLLPVSYASSDLSVAGISGSTVTIHKAGTVTITASQDGDSSFNPAASVTQDLTVSKANQAVTFTLGLKLVRGSNAVPFSDPATSSGGSGNAVTYSSTVPGVATVDSSGMVTIVGVGTTEIRAKQLGDADHYNDAPEVSQSLAVIAISLPVQDGLACWFDAGVGVTEDGSGVASWGDSSTLGHLATRGGGSPTVAPNDINGRQAVHLRGGATFFNCAGGMFAKEQYLVVRSPNATWNGSGAFLGRKSDDFLSVRASSYNMAGNTDGFWQDHFPQAVSKNGIALAANNVGGSAFHLAPITDYMLLKITVDNGASAENLALYPYYQIGKNETLGTMDFDVAEIIAYDRVLSSAEESLMNTYLTNKYWATPDPFQEWIDHYTFAAGADKTPTGDPDGDGMSNQQEYAFGLDPTKGSSVSPVTVPLDSGTGMFRYTRRNPTLTGLTYTVLTSTNLMTWTPNGGGGSQTPDSPTADVQTVTVVVDATASGGRLFVRVEAAPTPPP